MRLVSDVLSHLNVRNLAIIDSVGIDFGPGLNVLTGETGAGKSIVVDALALLAGARASSELIREGTATLTVTGLFAPRGEAWREALQGSGVAAEGEELSVRREISLEGPNRVFINDQPVTLRLLSELAPHLLRIHAQREELGLASAELQRRLLDWSGGDEARRLRAETRSSYERYRTLAERLERLSGDERARVERLDFLRFQRAEVEAAALRAGEEDELRREREVLRHAEAIVAALGRAVAHLDDDEGAAVERLAAAARLLGDIEGWEPRASEWRSEIEELRIRAGELARDAHRRLDEIDVEPQRLDEVEERLARLERLFRKYGATSVEVLESARRIGAEIEDLTLDEDEREGLEAEVASALEDYRRVAESLSEARRRWASELAGRVHGELADLAMKRATFSVALRRSRRSDSPLVIDGDGVWFGAEGIDDVTFELAANPGEPKKALAEVASGGELSRSYLALRLAAGEGFERSAAALVFDEVDAGVGGAEAAALGRKLHRLAADGQVLAVTHLPQVASCGDRHHRVRKKVKGGRTTIEVELLSEERRVEEIARLLAGRKVTEISRSHARELLAGAR